MQSEHFTDFDAFASSVRGVDSVMLLRRVGDGKAVVTPVKISESNLTHTIIKSGVTSEDKIVVGPYKVLESIEHDQVIQDERESKTKKPGAKAKRDEETADDADDGS